MSAINVTLRATKAPLHSGSWSGPIPDPAQALCRMIASLTDKDGKILIPHYEDDVIPPTKEELESYKSLGMTEKIFRNDGGILDQVDLNVPEDEILISLWRRPSIIVSTIESGSRANAGNVLQDSAYARIGIRLAPGMDANKCTDMLADFLKAQVPNNMEITIDKEDGANPFVTDTTHPFFKKMSDAMTDAYGSPTMIHCRDCKLLVSWIAKSVWNTLSNALSGMVSNKHFSTVGNQYKHQALSLSFQNFNVSKSRLLQLIFFIYQICSPIFNTLNK